MKKILLFGLMAVMMICLSLNVTSCKDDDNDGGNTNSGSAEEQQSELSNDFWAVVGQLVGMSNATDDYQNKTFAPTIGEAVTGNETVRRVSVNTLESAAERFQGLVGLDEGTITEETNTYTWTSEAVGSLTYTKSTDGQSLATVDVNIPQVPGLRQIVYMTPDQMGTNASSKDWKTCYYRFGDVIKRTVKDITEYWICVRPSFDPEGKKKSYWVTVSPLPEKNIEEYKKASNKLNYSLPTKLGQNDDQMENLAEMLYAMYDPGKWEENINGNPDGIIFKGIEMFQDFDKKKLDYHSKYFWERVAKGWEETSEETTIVYRTEIKKDLWETIFGLPKGLFYDQMNDGGLHFLYYGYKWKWTFFNDLTLYEQVFTPKGDKKKSNMHNMTKRSINHTVIDKRNKENDIQVDVATQYTSSHPYLDNNTLKSENGTQKFFGENDNMPHYIIRFATGDELAAETKGGEYNKSASMPGFTDVYRYNAKYNRSTTESPEDRNEAEFGYKKNDDGLVISAPDNATGVYQIGDVLECVEDGTKWFCILGKPQSNNFPVEDQEATFVSLEFPSSSYNDVKVQGLPTEEELPECAYRFIVFLNNLNQEATLRMEMWNGGKLGVVGEHIKQYANVDLHDLYLYADSAWVFKDGNSNNVTSHSDNTLTNLAYDDGNNNHQAVARLIYDATQGGDQRNKCSGTTKDGKPWEFKDWHFLFFKHYEYFDSSRQTPFATGWEDAGATAWQWFWPVSNTQITLQDLVDQDIVNEYAGPDKWTRLPLIGANKVRGNRRSPRTKAYTSVRPSDFFYKNGAFASDKRSMWNEPVLFMRFAKIVDPGNRQLNLKSTDGRTFKVVHLLSNSMIYSGATSALWAMNALVDRESNVFVDNKVNQLPEIK